MTTPFQTEVLSRFAEHLAVHGVPASRHAVFGDRGPADAPDSIAKQNAAIADLCAAGLLRESGLRDEHGAQKYQLTSTGWFAAGKSLPQPTPLKAGVNGKRTTKHRKAG